MEIHTISEENLDLISSICLDPSVDQETREMMENAMDERINWIKSMIPKGLEILVALEKPRPDKINYKWVGKMLHSDLTVKGWVPMGLLEFIPIEYALEPVEGNNSLFINCMWILPPFWHRGVGKVLIESFIEKAKMIGSASVIGYDGDSWFGTSIKYMPLSFFKKFGFEEVDRDESRVLLFLNLGNNQCPWSRYMINTFKKELNQYSNLEISIIDTNNKELIQNIGMARGVCLNGFPILNRMASWKELELELAKYRIK
jgi:GNAT superfamily N-acetyltransferase